MTHDPAAKTKRQVGKWIRLKSSGHGPFRGPLTRARRARTACPAHAEQGWAW